MKTVKLSVVMLSYNNGAYLKEAMEAVLNQEVDFNCELIICDDNSSDNSVEVIKSVISMNPFFEIKWFKQSVNVGMGINFNFALRKSKGEYIAICDGDDKWINRGRLKEQVSFLDAHPEYGTICGDMEIIDQNGELINWLPLKDLRKRYSTGHVFFKQAISASINTLTAVFRRDLIKECFEEEPKWYLADLWIWLRVSMKSKVYHVDKIYGHYRRHSNNITSEANLNTRINKARLFCIMYDNIMFYCDRYLKSTNKKDQEILFIVLIKLFLNTKADLAKRIAMLKYILKIAVNLHNAPTVIRNRKMILKEYVYA